MADFKTQADASINSYEFYKEGAAALCNSINIHHCMRNLLNFLHAYDIKADAIETIIVEPDFVTHTIISVINNEKFLSDEPKSFYVPLDIGRRMKNNFEAENGQCVIDGVRRMDMADWLESITGRKYVSSILIPLRLVNGYVGRIVLLSNHPGTYSLREAQLLSLLRVPFILILNNYMASHTLPGVTLNPQEEPPKAEYTQSIIGAGNGLRGIIEAAHAIAPFDTPVLITGETGTGKEMIANEVHYSSPRKNKRFIKINCGAIPRDLIESALFGHEKGAFTGAIYQTRGCFETAADGDILLDEIGELPLDLQVKLLRVLQFQEFSRVGSQHTIASKARVIACTNCDLRQLVNQNRFRADLYYRLNVFPLQLPSLRERKEDLPQLIGYFISTKSAKLHLKLAPIVDEISLQKALEYDWPGNVRELENCIERALIKCHSRNQDKLTLEFGDYLELNALNTENQPPVNLSIAGLNEVNTDNTGATSGNGHGLYTETMINCIKAALQQCNGRISGPRGAALVLGIHPNTLRSRMARLGIKN